MSTNSETTVIKTPEGDGELTNEGKGGWLVNLPFASFRYVGTRAQVRQLIKRSIDQYQEEAKNNDDATKLERHSLSTR
jgi:hypothetical protein